MICYLRGQLIAVKILCLINKMNLNTINLTYKEGIKTILSLQQMDFKIYP